MRWQNACIPLLGQRPALGRRDGQKVVTSKQHKANTFYKLNLSIISGSHAALRARSRRHTHQLDIRPVSPVRVCICALITTTVRAHQFTTASLSAGDKMHFEAPCVICQRLRGRQLNILKCKARHCTLPFYGRIFYVYEGVALPPIVFDFMRVSPTNCNMCEIYCHTAV